MDIDGRASNLPSVRMERISAMEEINIMVENSDRDESNAMEERDSTEDNDEDMSENDSGMDIQDPADQSNATHTLPTSSTRRSARDVRPIHSSSSSSASSIKKTKAKETHMHTILREALPEGSVVSQDTLERLAKAFTSIVKEASAAAAKAAVNKTRASTGARAASGPRTAKRAVRNGRVTKLTTTTTTTTPKKAESSPKEKKKTKKKNIEEDDQEEKDKLEDDGEEAEEEEDEDEDEDEDEVFEVESILEHKFVRGKILFKIKWSGYPVSQSTWETRSSLDGCKDLLQAYAKKNKLTI
ncbi:hypothetical protein BG011_009805 [Mortierella polycephala]|uniref:Chromo domain-containing protein n=1 Tax=Mortierella polycephala TaxID=41804 RepID=A0A9P6TVV9_9FUNG|nr:hypothetical protein BG011_009805 [Mortierella polycephala]